VFISLESQYVPQEHLELTARFQLTFDNHYAPNERSELAARFHLTPEGQWAPSNCNDNSFVCVGGGCENQYGAQSALSPTVC
jgi:hypothetical protein